MFHFRSHQLYKHTNHFKLINLYFRLKYGLDITEIVVAGAGAFLFIYEYTFGMDILKPIHLHQKWRINYHHCMNHIDEVCVCLCVRLLTLLLLKYKHLY